MTITKKNAKAIEKIYGFDVTTVKTVTELVALFEENKPCWFEVVMEADLCDETVHYIETVENDLVIFITEENSDNLKEIYLGT